MDLINLILKHSGAKINKIPEIKEMIEKSFKPLV
jgi:hypothetical protein